MDLQEPISITNTGALAIKTILFWGWPKKIPLPYTNTSQAGNLLITSYQQRVRAQALGFPRSQESAVTASMRLRPTDVRGLLLMPASP